jgi:ribosomal protein L16/L10AE
MGKGKGKNVEFLSKIKQGTQLFELEYFNSESALRSFYLAIKKLPLKCFIFNNLIKN